MLDDASDEMNDEARTISREELQTRNAMLFLDQVELQPGQFGLLDSGIGREFRGIRAGARGFVGADQKRYLGATNNSQNGSEDGQPTRITREPIIRTPLDGFLIGLFAGVI